MTTRFRAIPPLAVFLALLLVAGLSAAWQQRASAAPPSGPAIQRWTVAIVGTLPHERDAFVEGLEMDSHARWIYESTGLFGHSSLRQLDPANGTVHARTGLPASIFAEGITLIGNTAWMLTWRNQTAIQWDLATMTPIRRVPYSGEGWGLCHQERRGNRLVQSDGTDRLTFRDPTTFAVTGHLHVTRRDHQPVAGLNELECAGHQIYANLWPTTDIAVIDDVTGQVTALIDCSPLLAHLKPPARRTDILNGIAADPAHPGQWLLTGKHWPQIFRVRFEPA